LTIDYRAAMRKLLIVAVVTAACGGPSKPPSPAPTPPPETARHDEPAGSPPAAAAIDATPDVPSGADAARDAELAKVAASIIDTTVNTQPQLTRDGKRVVFVSNRDGLPQLYIADAGKPDAPATRLVTSTERVATPSNAATLTPDGKSLVYRSDHGADENWQLFRLSLGGGEPVLLTPGAKRRRDEVIIPAGKPDTLFYSASAMAEVGESIYAASLAAPGEEKLIYHDDKPGGLADVSRDGAWGLYVRTHRAPRTTCSRSTSRPAPPGPSIPRMAPRSRSTARASRPTESAPSSPPTAAPSRR
jgi:hypothetical protein